MNGSSDLRQLIFTAESLPRPFVANWRETVVTPDQGPSADRFAALWQLLNKSIAPAPARMRAALASNVNDEVSCADPVFLQANMDRLILQGRIDDLGSADIQALNDAFADLLKDDDIELQLLRSGQGVLSAPHSTQRAEPAAYRQVDMRETAATEPLPRRLQALEAEIQMLLHDHPVNITRSQRGQLPVSSLWLWGGGQAQVVPSQPLPRLYGYDATLAGWWHQQCAGQPSESDLPALLAATEDVVISIETAAAMAVAQEYLAGLSSRAARRSEVFFCDADGLRQAMRPRRWWPRFGQN